jgi:hypothetical protein
MWEKPWPLLDADVSDLWDATNCNWKEFKDLGLRRTSTSIVTYNNLVINMPWDPCTTYSTITQGYWVGVIQQTQFEWVYLVLEVIGDSIMVYEFKICSTSSKLERVESQLVHLASLDVSRVRVLVCNNLKGHYEIIHLKSLMDFGVPDVMGEGPTIST